RSRYVWNRVEFYCERGSGSRRTFKRQGSRVFLHDALRYRKTQTGSQVPRLRRKESIKHPALDLIGHAWAVVDNLNANHVLLLIAERSHGNISPVLVLRRGMLCILQQIQDNLPDSARINSYERQLLEVERDSH